MDIRPFLGQAPDWYRDVTDPCLFRYWDGTEIIAERHWDGTGWVDWWQASDGEFYPPELRPVVPAPVPLPVAEQAPALAEAAPVEKTDPFASTPTTPPRRHRKVLALSAVGVAIALAIALVVGVSAPKSAEATVLGAVNSTLADKTAHVSMTMIGGANGAAMTATGTGGVDFTQNALRVGLSIDVGPQSLDVQAIYLGGTIYESIPQISEIEPGKSWLSLDLSSITSTSGVGATNSLSVEGNPADLLRMLTEHGNSVTQIGTSTIDGVAVQGYAVSVSAAQIRSELAGANLPAWMRTAMSKVGIQGIDYKVYIDEQGLLRRLAISMQMTAGGNAVSMNETFDFSDYGTPVSVSAPPADQVVGFQQFVQDAQAASQQAPQ